MTWYYHLGGQQQGPVSDAELANLLQVGKINGNTPVWREGMANWQPLSVARPAAPPLIPGVPGSGVCVQCGRSFPSDELITLNKSPVCAQCKPLFLQRMAEGVAVTGVAGIWREGKKLVTRSETPFPDRCVKCNAPANGFKLKRTLYWHHPAIYLMLLLICIISIFGIIAFVVVSIVTRKKAVLHIGLCEAHRAQRRIGIYICTLGMLGGVALLVGAIIAESWWIALAGGVTFFFGAIWGVVRTRMIAATKIDKDFVWVSGVGRAFLNELPER